MGQKKKKTKTPKEDIRMEFATDERAEAFTLGLTSSFPDCKFTLSDVTVCIWAPKSALADIRAMSENSAYARRKIMCFTPFWLLFSNWSNKRQMLKHLPLLLYNIFHKNGFQYSYINIFYTILSNILV